MSRLPEAEIERIKQSIDLVALISARGIALKKPARIIKAAARSMPSVRRRSPSRRAPDSGTASAAAAAVMRSASSN